MAKQPTSLHTREHSLYRQAILAIGERELTIAERRALWWWRIGEEGR